MCFTGKIQKKTAVLLLCACVLCESAGAAEGVAAYGRAAVKGLRSVGKVTESGAKRLFKRAKSGVSSLFSDSDADEPGVDGQFSESSLDSEIHRPSSQMGQVVVYAARPENIANSPEKMPKKQEIADNTDFSVKSDNAVFTVKPAKKKRAEYRFCVADKIYINMLGDPSAAKVVEIAADGSVSYLYDEVFYAAGQTRAGLERELSRRMSKYFDRPVISVTAVQLNGRSVFVYAGKSFAGRVFIGRNESLQTVLQRAGIFSEINKFDLNGAVLLRGGRVANANLAEISTKTQVFANIKALPGDFVYLPAKGFAGNTQAPVIVAGDVRREGVFAEAGTFLQAMTEAGGLPENNAKYYLLRGGLRNMRGMYEIDYTRIAGGLASDVQLQGGDIIYVTQTAQNERNSTKIFNSAVKTVRYALERDIAIKSANRRLAFLASANY